MLKIIIWLITAAVAPPTSCDPFQVSDDVYLTCPPAGYEGPGWTLEIKYILLLNFNFQTLDELSSRRKEQKSTSHRAFAQREKKV